MLRYGDPEKRAKEKNCAARRDASSAGALRKRRGGRPPAPLGTMINALLLAVVLLILWMALLLRVVKATGDSLKVLNTVPSALDIRWFAPMGEKVISVDTRQEAFFPQLIHHATCS